MEVREARELIQGAILRTGGAWVDLGAGSGVFTRALAGLVGPTGRVIALDRDEQALALLAGGVSSAAGGAAKIVVTVGDFTQELAEQLSGEQLTGALLANALHFAADPRFVLEQIARLLIPDGRVVVVEYEQRAASPWVPYPLPFNRLVEVAPHPYRPPIRIAERASIYGGTLYCAVLDLHQ